jgi:phage baseplate assembly protein V
VAVSGGGVDPVPGPSGPSTSGLIAGAVLGVVEDVDDPERQGKVRVRVPELGQNFLTTWAPIAALMAGDDRGAWMLPEVGDEAVVIFRRGDVNYPIVVGFVWNGVDRAPSTSVRERLIRSRNGHTIRLIDSTPTAGGNRGAVVVEDAHGNQIVLTNGKVTVRSRGVLELAGATVVIRTAGVTRVVSPTPNPL